jgi:hypothetical protein
VGREIRTLRYVQTERSDILMVLLFCYAEEGLTDIINFGVRTDAS